MPSVAASAATTLTGSTQMSCTYNDWDMPYSADATVTVDGTAVTVTLPRLESSVLDDVPAFVVVGKVAAATTATIAGQSVALAGEVTVDPRAPLNTGSVIPTLTGTLAAPLDGSRVSLGDLALTLTTYAFSPAPSTATVNCAVDAPEAVTLTKSQAFDCVYGNFSPIRYDATATVKLEGDAVEASFSDFPAMSNVPAFVTLSHARTNATLAFDTESVDVTGAEDIPNKPLNAGMAMPKAHGALTEAGTPGSFDVSALSVDVVAMGTEGTMACTAVEPEPEPEPEPVVKVKPSITKVKAAYAKKKKLLTVKGQVAGSKGVATGKVKITVKKGKKTVKLVTVKLTAKGAFTAKVKKLKAKGKHKVVIQYLGDASYTKAQVTKQFKA